jgi:hypothetical protein
MPNYEHFKKYDEWSKQKPSPPADEAAGQAPSGDPAAKPESGLSKILKSLKGTGKKS